MPSKVYSEKQAHQLVPFFGFTPSIYNEDFNSIHIYSYLVYHSPHHFGRIFSCDLFVRKTE
jgi:hypothetical protein